MQPAEKYLGEVLEAYDLHAPVVGAVRFGQGHINDTFCVHTQPPEGDCVRFILQRISDAAFSSPVQLMQNIVGVTDYLKRIITEEGGDPERRPSPFCIPGPVRPFIPTGGARLEMYALHRGYRLSPIR